MAFSVCSLAAARTCRSGPEGRQAHGCPSAAQPLTPCCRPPSGRRCLAVRARDLGRTSELSLKNQAKNEQVEIQDKLIAVFQSRKQSEWKKIIGFSKQWQSLADGVFKRVDELIRSEEDPNQKLKLRRFLRGLRSASDDVAQTAQLFAKFDKADPIEYESIVAGNALALNAAFYEYLQNIIMAAHEDKPRQEELLKLGAQVSALQEAFAKIEADAAVMQNAAEKFHTLLEVGSLAEADAKIDAMAASGELDPAMLLTMAKAYSGVKETDYTKEEVKDVMYHLYLKGKEAAARDAPREVRILKHLLSLEDPRERAVELENAVTKGPELETPEKDYLSSDPPRMMATVDTVLRAYENRGQASLLGQTADLMNPEVILRLKEIRDLLQKQYL